VDDRRPTIASHDAEITDELRASMREGWLDRKPLVTAPSGVASYAAKRRDQLSAAFPRERLVIRAGGLLTRSNDTEYPFRPSSDFAWLVGWAEPDAVLVMEPTGSGHACVLYVRERGDRSTDAFWRDRTYGELWTGAVPSHAEVALSTGIDVRALADPRAEDDPEPDTLGRVLAELRLVKDDWEVEQLVAAVSATAHGFDDVVARLATAPSERWLEGTFFRRARHEGNAVGYGSIVGCGAHATCLHWTRNDGEVRAGDLALMDMGVEMSSLYTADVTRVVPISGTFTATQADVYDAVFDAQAAGLAEVKPGAPFTAPHDAAMRVLTERLAGWGLLKGSVDELMATQLYRRYTLHGTSHMLGLDVHDCAQARHEHYRGGPLEPGMVLTVEPGVYFQENDATVPPELRGIGVRIEDDVLVTAAGARVLSGDIPKERAAVERWANTR
jgi:Xaa-Pro aminopeptidase